MSIVKVRLEDINLKQDENGLREEWTYTVQSSAPVTPSGLYAILTATDGTTTVPAWGATHPTRSGLKVTNVQLDKKSGPILKTVVVTYSTPTFGGEVVPIAGGVWNKRVEFGGMLTTVKTNRDKDGKSIVNPLNEILPPQFDRPDYSIEVINVSFDTDNMTTRGPAIRVSRGKLNDATVTLTIQGSDFWSTSYTETFAAGTLMLGDVRYTVAIDPTGTRKWHVDMPLLYRNQIQIESEGTQIGWAEQFVYTGFNYLDSNDKLVHSPTEVYLTGDGHKLADGDTVMTETVDLVEQVSFTAVLAGI